MIFRSHASPLVVCRRVAVGAAIACSTLLGFASSAAFAQTPHAGHYLFPSQTPPGQVGQQRLQRGGPVVGYFQPVSFTMPAEVLGSVARDGGWTEPTHDVVTAGMLIGQTYRLKLENLPLHPGRECYPTVEIIDRTYPPAGMEKRFPVPIVFNEDDIRLAMDGMYVTRVVYVEDPQQAIPGAQKPGEQLWHDAGPNANPLEVADQLGRPIAIVRMGGRIPDESQGPDWQFMYGCPKWLFFGITPAPPPFQPTPGRAQPLPPAAEPVPQPQPGAAPKSARRLQPAETN